MPDSLADNFEHYLRQGKLEPACHLILQFAAQPHASAGALAQTVAVTLDRLLDELVIEQVVRFFAEMGNYLPAELCDAVKNQAGRRIEVIRDWSNKMILVSRERQARELRAALRGRDLGLAEQYVAAILAPPAGRAEPDRTLIEYVGSVLGSVEHGQREAEQLLVRLRTTGSRLGLSEETLELMERSRVERQRGAARGRAEFPEAEFVRDLNALVVELKGRLPSPLVMGAPDEEQIAGFYQALHAIVASVFRGRDPTRWIDVTAVLVEYCPRELSVAGRRSGVEQRAYMTLTPTGRRAVFEAFGRLGRSAAVAQAYLDFAQTVKDERLLRRVIEVMGALRSKAFLGWLRKVVESESGVVRGDAFVAISSYADGDSAELLLRALSAAIRRGTKRGILPEGPARREAEEAIFALGRIVRSPRMDPGGRNEIFKRAVAALAGADPRVQFELAYQCFQSPSEGWDAALRDWAASTLTRSLWLGDLTPDFAAGDDRQANLLGPRAPMVRALIALGRGALPAILAACEDSGLRYGGAYVALGEVLGKLGDPAALGLLERLLANALLHEGTESGKYQSEKYYDPTEGVRKEITPDHVIGALLFALEQIGDEQAEAILVRAYNQIHAPGVGSPGGETTGVLERVRARLLREGRWNQLVRQAGERRVERNEKRDEAADRRAALQALKILQSRLFLLGGRREKKITAIQTLASQRNLEALPLIMAHLNDGDALVNGAARTALGEYAWAAANETVERALTYELLEALGSRNEAIREAVRPVLKRLGPAREPLRSKLRALSEHSEDPLLRAEAARLLREGMEPDALDVLGTAADTAVGEAEPPNSAAPAAGESNGGRRDLDRLMRQKRDYLQARQAWIRGGKKGEPPKPPEEGE